MKLCCIEVEMIGCKVVVSKSWLKRVVCSALLISRLSNQVKVLMYKSRNLLVDSRFCLKMSTIV